MIYACIFFITLWASTLCAMDYEEKGQRLLDLAEYAKTPEEWKSAIGLVQEGADVNYYENNFIKSCTPLHAWVCMLDRKPPVEIGEEYFEFGEMLLQKDADIEREDSDGMTALLAAIRNGYPHQTCLVKWLLAHKANACARCNDNSNALHVLAAHPTPDFNAVELLIKAGIDVNEKNKDGFTPLCLAAIQLQNKLDKHSLTRSGSSIFHKELESLVKCLLENSADPNIPSNTGVTAWQHSIVQILCVQVKPSGKT